MLLKSQLHMLLFLLGLNQLKPQWLNHTVLSSLDVLVSFCSSFLSRWGQAIAPKCIRVIHVLLCCLLVI